MNRTVLPIMALSGLLVAPSLGLLAQPAPTPWLHIRVEEPDKPSKVSVNLPLTVVQAMLKSAPDTLGRHGRVRLGMDDEMSVSEFRRLWNEFKDAGDTDIVTVEERGESVRVGRKGEIVEIVVEKPRGTQRTHVQVPVSLVDALLSSEGEQVNVEAALAELMKRRGDIVQVDDETNTVRIWIDEGK